MDLKGSPRNVKFGKFSNSTEIHAHLTCFICKLVVFNLGYKKTNLALILLTERLLKEMLCDANSFAVEKFGYLKMTFLWWAA